MEESNLKGRCKNEVTFSKNQLENDDNLINSQKNNVTILFDYNKLTIPKLRQLCIYFDIDQGNNKNSFIENLLKSKIPIEIIKNHINLIQTEEFMIECHKIINGGKEFHLVNGKWIEIKFTHRFFSKFSISKNFKNKRFVCGADKSIQGEYICDKCNEICVMRERENKFFVS